MDGEYIPMSVKPTLASCLLHIQYFESMRTDCFVQLGISAEYIRTDEDFWEYSEGIY